jgi:hypothetical protein
VSSIFGAVEIRTIDEWYDVISISSLLMSHADLNACLFGVDNYAEYRPLFANRGLPHDCSFTISESAGSLITESSSPSWVLWNELEMVDWEEEAVGRDQRITEFALEDGKEIIVSKWLNRSPGDDWVREALDRDPQAVIRTDTRVFRRLILKRRDCLLDTDFPLLMNMMALLAGRFGNDHVRMVVWFD